MPHFSRFSAVVLTFFRLSICNSSVPCVPMPWKKRILLQIEQQQCDVEPAAAPAVVKAEPEPSLDSGIIMEDTMSLEHAEESAGNFVLEAAADGGLDSPEESKPADDIEGMAE